MQLSKMSVIYRRTALLALFWLLALSASRLVLLGLFWARVEPTGGVSFILAQGVRFDLILLGLLFGPAWLTLSWLHSSAALRHLARWLIPLWFALATALAFFVEASSASFIMQFDSRPNYLFVEYLAYPGVVLATLSGTHMLELALFTSCAVALVVIVFRWLRRDPNASKDTTISFCLVSTVLIALLVLAMVRSTLDHRPANPSNASFSNDAMVNQLPLNSPYSVLYAVYKRHRLSQASQIHYADMPTQRINKIVLSDSGITRKQQIDPSIPTLHHQHASHEHQPPLNLVIILMESVGAEYVGALGGADLTPNLDQLADEGIWMERLYATGIRSARGIEAVITGFTPTPMPSVVKRDDTQEGFFTLPSLLQQHGYQTSFLYGGESHFDNMRRFFFNNGFEQVVDEKDFKNPVFKGSWGVSDEDLMQMAHEKFDAMGDQPFFSLVFTTSNHEPFDIPSGRVEDSPLGPRETTIAYSDYAIGQFLQQARASEYWDNTVFLIIADHNARVFGSHLVPVERFRIPGVIVGSTIEPRRITGITSQIDMIPTLLSLIGLSTDHPGIGKDLTRPPHLDGAGRAMMQFHSNQAWMEKDWVIIFRPDLKLTTFQVDPQGELYKSERAPFKIRQSAIAHALWGPKAIANNAYRLPSGSETQD